MKSIFFMLFVLLISCNSIQQESKFDLKGSELPRFNILLMDSITQFNTANLPKAKHTVLFFINPDCPYCRAQTEDILKQITKFKHTQFCIFTYAPYYSTKSYYDKYKLDGYKNIIVGIDVDAFFYPYFKTTAVPFLAVYDSERKLEKIKVGQANANEIKEILQ